MPKIISKAKQARLNYGAKIGEYVTVERAALLAEVDRGALGRLEKGSTERFDGPMIARLCALYGIGIGDMLEYSEEIRNTESVPAGIGTY